MNDHKSTPAHGTQHRYCSAKATIPAPLLSASIRPDRAELIRLLITKWLNGTVLHCFFFGGEEEQRQIVRNAWETWKKIPLGVEFKEVTNPQQAEIRIGFVPGDGSWSYVGRDCLTIPVTERTMNFGWDLRGEEDTALHEFGHAIGFCHEHQNPFAGIVWNEEEVYRQLAGPPNNWSRQTTYDNIIRKLDPSEVRGSEWDPNSIMHYPFGAGMILKPAGYTSGLTPKGGLSELDKKWASTFYPAKEVTPSELKLLNSVNISNLKNKEQIEFIIKPKETTTYTIQTFGKSDTLIALYKESKHGEIKYMTADDDGGEDRNAKLVVKLFFDVTYRLRLRMTYNGGEAALLMSN